MSTSLITQLNRINARVSDAVPFVNWGGCAFYSALIQQRLHELGHDTETGIISYTPPDGADHVFTVVKIAGKEYFHDGEDTMPLEAWSDSWLRKPASDAPEVVNSNRWNTQFDAKLEVPILCGIIEEILGPFVKRPHFHTIQGINV